jgi:hypothetical protein
MQLPARKSFVPLARPNDVPRATARRVCAHLAADNAKEAKRAVEWVKEWPK